MNIIVAACKNMGIGFENNLPWLLKKELLYFKRKTVGNNLIVMGKNTWESLPSKPLPNRLNCILSSSLKNNNNNIQIFNNKNDFLNFTNTVPLENIWIIGGESIYKQFINEPYVKNIYLTHILHDFECDTFFPKIPYDYSLVDESNLIVENNIYYKHKLFSKNHGDISSYSSGYLKIKDQSMDYL